MSSFTVSFTGSSSLLRADFFSEITLDPNANYSCALLDFTSYNSIPNITEGKNNEFVFNFYEKNGIRTLKNTMNYLERAIFHFLLNYLKWELAARGISLSYEINAGTSSVGIEFDSIVIWTGGTVLNVIGFQNKQTFESKKKYRSEHIVRITNIDIIRIECDIVSGSYINGQHSHTIHQFSHCKVAPGYKFIEVPRHLIYLPTKDRQLRSIQISVVDQNGELVDFRGEQISCRVHIKKVDG